MKIVYPSDYKKQVLAAFDLKVVDGLVVDKKTGNPVRDNTNTELQEKNFVGIRKGSIEYINNNVISLIKLRKKLRG